MKTVFLLIVLSVSGILTAQEQFRYSSEAETVFTQGLELYTAGSYENAADVFETGVNINPVHQRTTACYMMAAKSWLTIHEEAQALFLMNNLLKRFPETEYAREAHFTLGIINYALKANKESVKEFLLVREYEISDEMKLRAESLIDSIVTFVLTPVEREELANEIQNEFIQSLVERIASTPPQVITEPPKEIVPSTERSKVIRIGAVLPLMEKSSATAIKKAAEDLLEGMTIAQKQFEERNPDIGIDLQVRDEERDSSTAKKLTKQFVSDSQVLAMIGPLFSNTTQSCAPIANEGELPLITPTANAVGLAGLGSYIFQANADIGMHGKALARYAVNDLGLTTFAVIAPNNPNIKIIVNDFIAEVKHLGATVLANESYESSSDDLSKQFLALRRSTKSTEPLVSFEKKITKQVRAKIIDAGVTPELLDSLIDVKGKIGVTKLFGKNGLRKAESLNLKIVTPKSIAEVKEIPLYAIEGVFAPVVSSEDIGVISSLLTYYSIRTQLLGGEEWYDEGTLQTQRRYAEGAIFCSDFYIDDNNPMVGIIQQHLKRKPTKYSLFGYDALNLVLSCIEHGESTRDDIQECLSNVRDWKGVHSSVTLSGGRVNKTIQILQFKDGEVRRLAEVVVE